MELANVNFNNPNLFIHKTKKTAALPGDENRALTSAASPSEERNNAVDLKNIKIYAAASGKIEKKLATAQKLLDKLTALAEKANEATTSDAERAVLNRKFGKIAGKLEKLIENANIKGQKIFDGNLNINAGEKLGSVIFNGAENQPTPEQANLTVPGFPDSLEPLSIETQVHSIVTLSNLQSLSNQIKTAQEEVSDFNTVLDFARNNLNAIPANQANFAGLNIEV